MKINTILLFCAIIASILLTVDAGSIRGLKKKDSLFENRKGKKGISPSEEETTTTPIPDDDPTSTTMKETIQLSNAATGDGDDDEIIEVEVALDLDDSLIADDQRKVSHAIIKALNELGIAALTEGDAPADAIMTLDRFTVDNDIEEVNLRRKLASGTYTKVIGTCTRCRRSRRERRNLKKAKSITKALEDKVNKILKESGEKGDEPLKIKEVKYFQFEK